MSDPIRVRALAAACFFLGTPYRHQGSRKGVGCDCVGLVRGVWRELYGEEPERPGPYSPDWAETGTADRLIEAARRYLVERPLETAEPGDVAIFRWKRYALAKHCGILDEGGRLIHAYEGAAVVSSPLSPGWAKCIAAVFSFPDNEV
ncbi:NlpC/P60 family protein [Consotaella salsifontis]|uniref:Putative phage cell wall peptidase, NlpC/P60 family n=1 Tax=Consotaella salsifontis TaxID=1365950 RepID=A0A1T4MD80_9HYPH|nr:NlpC/P60 family protein [Consotaella salsifontis]SJZ64882.1 putative phage cell wall peptidase, NlpC/P60 family [Consotaella salsifontis]